MLNLNPVRHKTVKRGRRLPDRERQNPMLPFSQQLELYARFWAPRFPERTETVQRYRQFVDQVPGCFERSNLDRHITGSALVVSPDLSQVLLTHHAKLQKWIQLGGHCDGNPLVHEVAAQEVLEESGLTGEFRSYGTGELIPLDLDILPVPRWQDVPAHDHYDARYLMVCDPQIPLAITEESLDLRWFSILEALTLCEPTVVRMLNKTSKLKLTLPGDDVGHGHRKQQGPAVL